MIALDVIVKLLAQTTKREYTRAVSAIRAAVPSTRWYVDATLAGERDRAAIPDYLATVLFSSLIVAGSLRKGVAFHALLVPPAYVSHLDVLGVRVLFDGAEAAVIDYRVAAASTGGRLVLIHRESRQHWLLTRARTLGDMWLEASGMELTTQRETNESVYMHMSLHEVELEPLPTRETHYVVRVGARTDRRVYGRTRRGTGYAYRIPYVESGEALHRMDARGVAGLADAPVSADGSGERVGREYVIDAPGMLGFGSFSQESLGEISAVVKPLLMSAVARVKSFSSSDVDAVAFKHAIDLEAQTKVVEFGLFLFIRDLSYLLKIEYYPSGPGQGRDALWAFVNSDLVRTWRVLHNTSPVGTYEVIPETETGSFRTAAPFGMCVLSYLHAITHQSGTGDRIFQAMSDRPYTEFVTGCSCCEVFRDTHHTAVGAGITAMIASGAVRWLSSAMRVGLALGVVHYITDRDVHDKDEIMRRLIADLRADDSDTRAQLHAELAAVVLELYRDDVDLVARCSICKSDNNRCARCALREENVKLHRKAVSNTLLSIVSADTAPTEWSFAYALVVVLGLSGSSSIVGNRLLEKVWSYVSVLVKTSKMLAGLVGRWKQRLGDAVHGITDRNSARKNVPTPPSDAHLAVLFVRSRMDLGGTGTLQGAYARELCAQIDVEGGYFDVACAMASGCNVHPMAVLGVGGNEFARMSRLRTSVRSIGKFACGSCDKAGRVVAYLHSMRDHMVPLHAMDRWIKRSVTTCPFCTTGHMPTGLDCVSGPRTFALCDGIVYRRDESDRLVLVSKHMGGVVDMMPSNASPSETVSEPNCVYFMGNVEVDEKSRLVQKSVAIDTGMDDDVTMFDIRGDRGVDAGGVCVIRVPDAMDLTEKLTRFLMHDAKPLMRLSRAAGVVSTRVTYVCAYGVADLKRYYGLLGDATIWLTNTSVLNRVDAAVVVVDDALANAIDRLQTRKYASGPLAARQLVKDLCGLRTVGSVDVELLAVVAFAYERVEFNQKIGSVVHENDAAVNSLKADFISRTSVAVKHACTALGIKPPSITHEPSLHSVYGGMDVYGVTEEDRERVRTIRSYVIDSVQKLQSS
jgi:hypothetical protein